jgi:outer membrane lipoprotein-sorting protein
MSGNRHDQSEDLLQRAVSATRELPLPSGPSAAVASQTLAALREAARRPKATLFERIHHMPWASKASAMLAVAASVVAVYFVLWNPTSGARAFAAFAEALNSVRSATWKTTTVTKGVQDGTITTSGIGMFLAPSHERMETLFQGTKSIQITDGQKDKVLTLIPATKTAVVIDLKNIPPGRESPFGNTFHGLQELVADAQSGKSGKTERLGVETIDGRLAEGFRIQFGSNDVKIWADPQTSLPVRMEQTTTSGPEGRTVMTDFQIDVDLDKTLFSLDVPKDYTVRQTAQLDLSKNPIYYLADTLKMTAEVNGGVFPPTLRGEEGIDGIMARSAQTLAKNMAEKLVGQEGKNALEAYKDAGFRLSMKFGGTFGFLSALSAENNDWHYAGKGVKLNTPNRPIFWFKRHKASTTYYVLFADLSVKEVPAEEAPKMPESEGGAKP